MNVKIEFHEEDLNTVCDTHVVVTDGTQMSACMGSSALRDKCGCSGSLDGTQRSPWSPCMPCAWGLLSFARTTDIRDCGFSSQEHYRPGPSLLMHVHVSFSLIHVPFLFTPAHVPINIVNSCLSPSMPVPHPCAFYFRLPCVYPACELNHHPDLLMLLALSPCHKIPVAPNSMHPPS